MLITKIVLPALAICFWTMCFYLCVCKVRKSCYLILLLIRNQKVTLQFENYLSATLWNITKIEVLSISINLHVQWFSIYLTSIFSNLINPVEDLVAYVLKLYEATHWTGSFKFPIASLVKATSGVFNYFEHFQSSDYTTWSRIFSGPVISTFFLVLFEAIVSYFKLVLAKS